MIKDYDMKINEKIKNLRKEKGITQERIAELLGMKTSTYSQMERSGKIPIDKILKLAKILEVNLLEILDPENPSLSLAIEPPQTANLNLEQPPTVAKEDYTIRANILSNREENAIIMLRNLKAEDRESVYALIKQCHDKKLKKNK